mgnify:CR=1 FL=1
MPCYDEHLYFKKRIVELENQVSQLRVSRRVLMNLIEKIENEKRNILNQWEKEKQRLRLDNQRYAKWLMENNYRYMELKASLEVANNSMGEE